MGWFYGRLNQDHIRLFAACILLLENYIFPTTFLIRVHVLSQRGKKVFKLAKT